MPSDHEPGPDGLVGATEIEGGAEDLYGLPEGVVPAILVEVDGESGRRRFTSTFSLGRDQTADVAVDAPQVSRVHAEVFWANRRWRVRDLGSTNGTYLEGTRIETAELGARNALRLGKEGPVVWLRVEGAREAAEPSLEHYTRRYVEGEAGAEDGHTAMIRRAVDLARQRQHRRWAAICAAVAVVLTLVAVAGWRFRAAQLERARATAQELFYTMKDLEVRLAELERDLAPAPGSEDAAPVAEGRNRLGQMSDAYDRYLEELDLLSERTPPNTLAVLKTVRVFGECEIAAPGDLIAEVGRYVDDWKNDTRFATALERARSNDYLRRAAVALDEAHLPVHYALVALQESDFREDAIGPRTRYGIAKGPWQFIPGTARAYGLTVGPLHRQREPDPEDERHDFDRSSAAAARYLRDLYLKEARGSGLLTLAMYNHGGSNVRRLLRSLPDTAAERNFWKVLLEHRAEFPRETYDYVFKIVAAAVILEDPARHGYPDVPPLLTVVEDAG